MNKTEAYKNEILPLVRTIKKLCYENGIPMFFAAAVKDDGKKTSYEYEMVSALIGAQPLTDDKIAKLVNVTMGYDVVLPDSPVEIDFDAEPFAFEEGIEDES